MDVIAPQGHETILVVDDNDLVRHSARAMLEALGYAVLEASDGQSALALLAKPAPVDLLLTDIVMPGGLNGPDLIRRARRLRPHLRALLTSGYAKDMPEFDGQALDRSEFLPKPYEVDVLAQAVRAALDAREP